ncbi:MAG TPA: hypothetical protein VKV28_16050 [Candidatus Binataceae bacterium]|nr:hypothetical protein [Candidatus Binataceae bacterium]
MMAAKPPEVGAGRCKCWGKRCSSRGFAQQAAWKKPVVSFPLAAGCILFLGLTWALTLTPRARAQDVTFTTAIPVAQGEAVTRLQLGDGYSAGSSHRELAGLDFPTVFAYGWRSKFTLFVTVPMSAYFLSDNTSAETATRSSSGFDDTLVFLRYTLFHFDWLTKTFRMAPFAGFYLPTGSDEKSDSLGRLTAKMQTGSGAVDPYLGTALTTFDLDYEFHWDFAYRVNSLADNSTRPGDVLETDAAFQYRILPWRIPDFGLPNFFDLDLETNLIWSQRGYLDGRRAANSGGVLWFLDPGLIFVTPSLQTGAVVQLPAFQDLYGAGRLATQYRVFGYLQQYFNLGAIFSRWRTASSL